MVARQQQQQLQQINPGIRGEGKGGFFLFLFFQIFPDFVIDHLGHILIASSILKRFILGLDWVWDQD